jgi:hypothetical protein
MAERAAERIIPVHITRTCKLTPELVRLAQLPPPSLAGLLTYLII